MSFIDKADKIVNSLCEFLDNGYIEYSLLVGGGVGYQSKKYIGNKKNGDLDLFLLVDKANLIKMINSVATFANNEKILEDATEDIELFKKKLINCIRQKTKIGNIYTSFNISTYARLIDLYKSLDEKNFYKIAYSKTNHLFIARSLNKGLALVVMLSKRITNTKKNGCYLVPDKTFIKSGSDYFLGLFTDFILKGTIRVDHGEKFHEIKRQIIKLIKPKVGKDSDAFIGVLANNKHFSQKIIQKLKKEYDEVVVKNFKILKAPNSAVKLIFTEGGEVSKNIEAKIRQYIVNNDIKISSNRDLVKLNNYLINIY